MYNAGQLHMRYRRVAIYLVRATGESSYKRGREKRMDHILATPLSLDEPTGRLPAQKKTSRLVARDGDVAVSRATVCFHITGAHRCRPLLLL